VTKETKNVALHRGRQVRDGGAYGCAVPRAYTSLNPDLSTLVTLVSCW